MVKAMTESAPDPLRQDGYTWDGTRWVPDIPLVPAGTQNGLVGRSSVGARCAQPFEVNPFVLILAWVSAVVTAFYMLPWAVSATRSMPNHGAVAVLNLLLGWTIIGWIVALVMACAQKTR
jgi:hypothetical protein